MVERKVFFEALKSWPDCLRYSNYISHPLLIHSSNLLFNDISILGPADQVNNSTSGAGHPARDTAISFSIPLNLLNSPLLAKCNISMNFMDLVPIVKWLADLTVRAVPGVG